MKSQTASVILAILFLLVAGLRIAVAFSEPNLSYDGYQHLRLVEHIKEKSTPLYEDNLSYGGRKFLYSPIFYYTMAFFSLFLPMIALLKFIPNLLMTTSIFLIYLITYDITKKRLVSLISVLFAGFTPIFFSQFINDASPWTLTIPLLLMALYGLMNAKKRYPLILFSSVLLSLISPIALLIPLSIGFFLLIIYMEKMPIDQEYKELFLFTLFFSLWSTLILYKDLFLKAGTKAVWQGLPTQLIGIVFGNLSLTNTAYTVGVLSISFGGFAAYHALFHTRFKKVFLISSTAGMIAIIMVLKILPLKVGLIILAILLSILAGRGLQLIMNYIEKTKIYWAKTPLILLGILFFIFSAMLPSISLAHSETPNQELIDAMHWIKNNTPEDSTILAPPIEGFLIEETANRASVIDNNFMLINKIDTIYEDVGNIYRSRFAISALKMISDYGIDYIIFDSNVKRIYARESLLYAENNCFNEVYNQTIIVYEVLCDVRTI